MGFIEIVKYRGNTIIIVFLSRARELGLDNTYLIQNFIFENYKYKTRLLYEDNELCMLRGWK